MRRFSYLEDRLFCIIFPLMVDHKSKGGGFMEESVLEKKRLVWVLALFAVVILLLSLRFFQIQILSTTKYTELAASQYQILVEGMDSRGKILDRNGIPLTGGQTQYYYFLPQQNIQEGTDVLLSKVSARKISVDSQGGMGYVVYRSQSLDEEVTEQLKEKYGAYIFSSPSRYADNQSASHLIGYLNGDENRGVSGLELAYELLLTPDGSQVHLWADGRGNILTGLEPQKENGKSFAKGSLVTTLDQGLQLAIEEGLEKRNVEGAVLVSEASSGEILAWVSSPTFNPNRVEDYLEQQNDCLVNKGIQGCWAPGSVFKLVVAAAALENQVELPEKFRCTGITTVEGVELGCLSGPEEGHGEVGLKEAMAVSCNGYFAVLGQKVGHEKILEIAKRLGFGELVFLTEEGNALFAEESIGNLPSKEETGQWDITNLSIGQGSILATPVQVHKMMTILANDGKEVSLYVVEGDQKNVQAEGIQILSSETTKTLQRLMEAVMTEGSGSAFDWGMPVYGKTGTAEVIQGQEAYNQCWFSGYCQWEGHRYVITISVEDGVSGSATAMPIFKEITDYVKEHNL